MITFVLAGIQLVPDGTIVIHIALILLMIFILNRTLFRPVNRILAAREERTKGRSGEAQNILQEVEANLSKYERTLREARAEGYQLLERERAEALRLRQEQVVAVREGLQQTLEGQKRELEAQAGSARQTLQQRAREMAAGISARILHRTASAGD